MFYLVYIIFYNLLNARSHVTWQSNACVIKYTNISCLSIQFKCILFVVKHQYYQNFHSKWVNFNPLTAATSLGVKRFRVFNITINIKDILWRRLGNYKIWRIYASAALKGLTNQTQYYLGHKMHIRLHQPSFSQQVGPKYTAVALLNFNPNSSEIIISGYVFYPPGTQLYIDAELNMTLPKLHPCQIRTKIHEKQSNEYQVR
jgi:hypothetical protein